jgi:Rrf2 family protein
MVELALGWGREPVRAAAIARRQRIPTPYLCQILHRLRKKGLVVSARGVRGGYALARRPARITVMEVLRALEGSMAPVRCVDEPGACGRVKRCPARRLWSRLKRAMEEVLEGATLEGLSRECSSCGASPAGKGGKRRT